MSHRYRLCPTKTQEAILREHCAHARFVWNLAVEQQSWWRPGRKSAPGWAEQCRQLTEARAAFPWLAAGCQTVQQQALRDFDRSIGYFFAGTHRRPTWRKAVRDEGFGIAGRRGGGQGYTWEARRISRRVGEVRIPKVGWVRFRWSRGVPADAKSYRVTLDRSGRWHISFAAPQSAIDRRPTGAVVGIDRGVRTALVTSDGQHFRAPRISDRRAVRYLTLQQRMSRQQKGSRKREKVRRKMARTMAGVVDRRKDWAEKVSTRLVRDHDVIVFERLRTRSMTRKPAPKPDPDLPGAHLPNGRRAKAGLSRGILASCWGQLAVRTEQKAAASGSLALFVNPRHSSQECRSCGHIAKENRESQAVFRCVSCGHGDHADANAAKNVLARGLGTLADPCARPGARGVCPQKSAQAAAGTIESSGLAAGSGCQVSHVITEGDGYYGVPFADEARPGRVAVSSAAGAS